MEPPGRAIIAFCAGNWLCSALFYLKVHIIRRVVMSQTEAIRRSFHNRFLRVDLTQGNISVEEPGLPYLRRYMGGWNIIADTLLKEVPAGVEALGPQNKLIFAPGVLTGLALSGVSRNGVGAKSPLTGAFGAAVRRADLRGRLARASVSLDQGWGGRAARRVAPLGPAHQGDAGGPAGGNGRATPGLCADRTRG